MATTYADITTENKDGLRTYNPNESKVEGRGTKVQAFYFEKNSQQTYKYATEMAERYGKLQGSRRTMLEALAYCENIVDDSDPDIDASQMQHAMQTAEACRKLFPAQDWLHLIGLIHDVGKVLVIPEMGGLKQWEVVGDTFPVGCGFSDQIVYNEAFAHNPDADNATYNSQCGLYQEGCGLQNVTMAWGHDEYLYLVLKNMAACKLPPEALYIIRYHSFYPWHNKGAYMHLCSEEDRLVLPLVKRFQSADLYSKIDKPLQWEGELKDYYTRLIDKYTPGEIQW